MKTIRFRLVDDFHGDPRLIEQALSLHYRIRADSDDPQVVFCGDSFRNGDYARYADALRINVQHENRTPNYSLYHYVLGFRYSQNPRHFRMPLYVRTTLPGQLIRQPGEANSLLATKTKFCAQVVSNAHSIRAWRRLSIADELDQRQPVDFGGRYRNNVGGPVADKFAFYAPYRFAICYENQVWPGHTTEKITDAMRMRCIPIYWGNPRIAEEFNPKSFVNAHEFRSTRALIERILEVDRSPRLYREMLGEPYFHDNRPNTYFDPVPLGQFLRRAIESPRPRLQRFPIGVSLSEMYRRLYPYLDYTVARLGIIP